MAATDEELEQVERQRDDESDRADNAERDLASVEAKLEAANDELETWRNWAAERRSEADNLERALGDTP